MSEPALTNAGSDSIDLDAATEILYRLYESVAIKRLPLTHHLIGVAIESMLDERAKIDLANDARCSSRNGGGLS